MAISGHGCAEEVPWPALLLDHVRGTLTEERRAPQTTLVLAVQEAFRCWEDFGRCETWLCLIDQLAPAPPWPLQLHLLVLLANVGTRDHHFILRAAEDLERFAAASQPASLQKGAPAISEGIASLVCLLRLRAVPLVALAGDVQSVEHMYQLIDNAVACIKKPRQEPSRKRPRDDKCSAGVGFDAAGMGVEPAEKAARAFVWEMTMAAWDNASSQVTDTPLPDAATVQKAFEALEVDFPVSQLQQVVRELGMACGGNVTADGSRDREPAPR
eukprot:TRINITY_DN35074_c0_g1_i1.p1 TRINITY_DN35074_c0_g1~~TRINITY_DN35074_c0_g1_i1.p1  ORF type:complete len:278 (-),score=52.75 TRINITY_DN35074_c0_g1_i1:132-944(-)